ncbi:MAG: DUF2290 domain-containing protein [Clostridium sp.]
MNDFDLIEDQFIKLQCIYRDFIKINVFNDYVKTQNSIGVNSEKINYTNYIEIYKKMNEENTYCIQMIDGSLICMYYKFDSGKNVIYHNLSFIPSYSTDICFDEDDMIGDEFEYSENLDINPTDFNRRLSNYIRIDFDDEGREEYYHALVHAHTGIFKDTVRFPINHYVTPFEFMYFIFKYLYREDDDLLDRLLFEFERECKLTANERGKVWINFFE